MLQMLSDGSWHRLGFALSAEQAVLTLDQESLMSTLTREIRTGQSEQDRSGQDRTVRNLRYRLG